MIYQLGIRGGICLTKESIQAFNVRSESEADCEKAGWCYIVIGNVTGNY